MLNKLYETLSDNVPDPEIGLLGFPLTSPDAVWLAIDDRAFPSLLLPAKAKDVRPNIVLRSLDVSFSRSCKISSTENEQHTGCYTIIVVKETDPDIVRLVLKVLEERFCKDELPSTASEIAANVQELAALFSLIENTSKDLIGLWGELNLILRSKNLLAAVKSWTSRKTAKYDFVSEDFVLDVKATLSATPLHRFSIEQLRPSGNVDAYILSLCLVEVQSGQSVGELMDAVASQLENPELRSAFLNQCLRKGGKDIYRSNMRLKTYPQDSSLSFYSARDIPVPEIDKAKPISNVRFDVTLSNLKPLERKSSDRILDF